MNKQTEAVVELHDFLTAINIPYAIIGGLAVQYWGEPRLTVDVDMVVVIPNGEEEAFCRSAIEKFTPRISNAVEFAVQNRILLLHAPNGCPFDISFGLSGYEDDMLKRIVSYEIVPGQQVFLCSAEDLIIHKAIAGRPRDIDDMKGIVLRQKDNMDMSYLNQWLTEFSCLLERPDIYQSFENAVSG